MDEQTREWVVELTLKMMGYSNARYSFDGTILCNAPQDVIDKVVDMASHLRRMPAREEDFYIERPGTGFYGFTNGKVKDNVHSMAYFIASRCTDGRHVAMQHHTAMVCAHISDEFRISARDIQGHWFPYCYVVDNIEEPAAVVESTFTRENTRWLVNQIESWKLELSDMGVWTLTDPEGKFGITSDEYRDVVVYQSKILFKLMEEKGIYAP